MRKVRDVVSPFQFRRNLEVPAPACRARVRWLVVAEVYTSVSTTLVGPLSLRIRLNLDRFYRGVVTGERITGGDT